MAAYSSSHINNGTWVPDKSASKQQNGPNIWTINQSSRVICFLLLTTLNLSEQQLGESFTFGQGVELAQLSGIVGNEWGGELYSLGVRRVLAGILHPLQIWNLEVVLDPVRWRWYPLRKTRMITCPLCHTTRKERFLEFNSAHHSNV
jgi:hypothetical protein